MNLRSLDHTVKALTHLLHSYCDLARYLVERQDLELWEKVLNKDVGDRILSKANRAQEFDAVKHI